MRSSAAQVVGEVLLSPRPALVSEFVVRADDGRGRRRVGKYCRAFSWAGKGRLEKTNNVGMTHCLVVRFTGVRKFVPGMDVSNQTRWNIW